jgi:predicted anti-sigma-YlaC factor YlaD
MNHITDEQLIDYLHQALAPEDDAAVYAHLNTCGQCARAYEDEAALTEALRAHASAEERDLPSGVVASVWAAVEASRSRSFLTRLTSTWLRPAVLLPLAAVIVIALLILPRLGPSAPAQTIGVAYYLQDHAAMGSTMPFAETNVLPASLENDDQGQSTAVAVTIPSMPA